MQQEADFILARGMFCMRDCDDVLNRIGDDKYLVSMYVCVYVCMYVCEIVMIYSIGSGMTSTL